MQVFIECFKCDKPTEAKDMNIIKDGKPRRNVLVCKSCGGNPHARDKDMA